MKKNHLNVATDDGLIYCKKTESVNILDAKHVGMCQDCPLFAGTLQGRGVECYWNDTRDIEEPYYVTEPVREYHSVDLAGLHRKDK